MLLLATASETVVGKSVTDEVEGGGEEENAGAGEE